MRTSALFCMVGFECVEGLSWIEEGAPCVGRSKVRGSRETGGLRQRRNWKINGREDGEDLGISLDRWTTSFASQPRTLSTTLSFLDETHSDVLYGIA